LPFWLQIYTDEGRMKEDEWNYGGNAATGWQIVRNTAAQKQADNQE